MNTQLLPTKMEQLPLQMLQEDVALFSPWAKQLELQEDWEQLELLREKQLELQKEKQLELPEEKQLELQKE